MIYDLQITSAANSILFQSAFPEKFTWLSQHGYYLLIKNPSDKHCELLTLELKLQGNSSDKYYRDEDVIFIFQHQIAELLAEHIVRDWEEKLMWKEVTRKGRRILIADQSTVMNKATNLLNRCTNNDSLNLLMNYGRKDKMTQIILDYLYYHHNLNIYGFINFCMQDYLREIKFAVDAACEELKNEREYNDFVKLLRYFVDTQPPMIWEVNIRMDDQGRFFLWDGYGNAIEENNMDLYLDDITRSEISLDDILVSILISLSPRTIILHNTGNEESESVKMIRNVFKDRIRECHDCEHCLSSSRQTGGHITEA